MRRICRQCHIEHDINRFRLTGKNYRSYQCHDCRAKEVREKYKKKSKHAPNNGRFVKGQKSLNPFPKGHVPWSKINKGKYQLGRKSTNRNSLNYLDWVKNVKDRDENKCRECGLTEFLEAHHIYNYELYPEKRCDIDNGITLCRSCHKRIESMLKKLKNAIIVWK